MILKKWLPFAGLALLACFSSGCESMSNTAKGGLVGGGLGAGLGAAAGGGKGALLGGIIGTGIGGLVGNDVDHQEKKQKEYELAAAQSAASGPRLGMTEVIQLTQQGLPENVIINQIRNTGSTFQLSVEDLRTLQANHVSPNVVGEMQNRPPVARVIRQPRPVVVYESYPPPPPVMVIGGGYYR